MTPSDCSICYCRLGIPSAVISLPCHETHQFHKICIRTLQNQAPEKETIPCPLCRKEVAIMTSPLQPFLKWRDKWIQSAHISFIIASAILGYRFAKTYASSLPILAQMTSGTLLIAGSRHILTSLPLTTPLPPALLLSIPIMAGFLPIRIPLPFSLPIITSVSLMNSSSLQERLSKVLSPWITPALIKVYNRMYGAAITSSAITLNNIRSILSPEQQLPLSILHCLHIQILEWKEQLLKLPLSEIDKKRIAPFIEKITSIIGNNSEEKDTIIKKIIQDMKTEEPTLHGQLLQVGLVLIYDAAYISLKENLQRTVTVRLLEYLKEENTLHPLDPSPDNPSYIRILVIHSLERFRQTQSFENPTKQEEWNTFVTSLQEEYKNAPETTMNPLSLAIGDDVASSGLGDLLCDLPLVTGTFKIIYERRQREFEERGFVFSLPSTPTEGDSSEEDDSN